MCVCVCTCVFKSETGGTRSCILPYGTNYTYAHLYSDLVYLHLLLSMCVSVFWYFVHLCLNYHHGAPASEGSKQINVILRQFEEDFLLSTIICHGLYCFKKVDHPNYF